MRPAPDAAPVAAAGVPEIMKRVLFALLPAVLCHVVVFGPGLIINLFWVILAALGAEAIALRLVSKPIRPALSDGSAVVSAALLALCLPPLVPWWIPSTGGVIAIVIAKHLYGGLGRNLFNPAMVAFAFLLLSFPVEMTQWLPPRMGDLDFTHPTGLDHLRYSLTGRLTGEVTVDSLTRATPLDLVKTGTRAGESVTEISADSSFGDLGGRGWEWISLCIALGGLYLLYSKTIRWHIPVGCLAGLLIPASFAYLIAPDRYLSPGGHLFMGASVLAAFFIATDPVTAAASNSGRLIFGAGIGLITFSIRAWGGYPDGVAFAVLLMNASVPLIDRYTRPRVFGHA